MPTLTGMNAPIVAAPGTQPWNTTGYTDPSGGGSSTPWWEQQGSSWGTVTPGQEYLPWNYPIGTPPPSLWGQMQNQPKALPPGQTSGGIMWGGTGTPAQTTLPDSLKASSGGAQDVLSNFLKSLAGMGSAAQPTLNPDGSWTTPGGGGIYSSATNPYLNPIGKTATQAPSTTVPTTTAPTTTQPQTTNPYSGLDANSILSSPYLSTSLMSLLGQSMPFGGSGTVGNQNQDMMYAY